MKQNICKGSGKPVSMFIDNTKLRQRLLKTKKNSLAYRGLKGTGLFCFYLFIIV